MGKRGGKFPVKTETHKEKDGIMLEVEIGER